MTDQKTPRGADGGPTGIEPISIIEEMQRSYLDYAMSVIVSRALPDVRDGLKPVHRRILYAAHESGYHWNRKYVKSARPVADVMGKYHPHGDASIYDALVRMAQDWSLRVPLIDGQGNFGSIDGDPPAAMRYTESRLTKVAHELLEDIDKDTVDFQETYDASEQRAEGSAGSLPQPSGQRFRRHRRRHGHQHSAAQSGRSLQRRHRHHRQSGDRPAGADGDHPRSRFPDRRHRAWPFRHLQRLFDRPRLHRHARQGQCRADAATTAKSIIITEVPYQVNKASMIEKMAELVRDKRIEGISDIRDESDRQGYRVVIELKRDAVADVILNQLYRFTPLQTSFGANMVALNGGKPEVMTLIDMLKAFVVLPRRGHQPPHEVPAAQGARPRPCPGRSRHCRRQHRRSDQADPHCARSADGARAVDGAALAVRRRRSADPSDRRSAPSHQRGRHLQSVRGAGARHPRHCSLQRLTALGRDEIADELNTIGEEIKDYLDILSSRARIQQIVKDELAAVRDEFGTPRRTELTDGGADMEDEDLIQREDMVVTVSHSGYIKRVPLSLYRAQRRGGKGRSGMSTKDEDFVTRLFVANTHTPVLFFSSRGIVYKEKVWRLPIGNPQSRGKALINMLPLEQGERITTIMPLPEDETSWGELDVMFATTRGTVRRNKLSDFVQVNRNGKIAMKFDEEGDAILGVETCTDNDDVLLTARFRPVHPLPGRRDVRVFQSRDSVRACAALRMAESDRAISMTIIEHVDATPAERAAYLKRAAAERRLRRRRPAKRKRSR